MAAIAHTLFGTTNKTGSVPSAANAGPVFSPGGSLMVNESFTDFFSICHKTWFDTGLRTLLSGEDYLETYRLWDCYQEQWVEGDLDLHRFNNYDLIVRRQGERACTWRGALDTNQRIATSADPEEDSSRCWQWMLYCTCLNWHSKLA